MVKTYLLMIGSLGGGESSTKTGGEDDRSRVAAAKVLRVPIVLNGLKGSGGVAVGSEDTVAAAGLDGSAPAPGMALFTASCKLMIKAAFRSSF